MSKKYGESLLYVRYRYDEQRGVRLKTVEIVVEEKPWTPALRLRDEDVVPITVAYAEKELREKLKTGDGTGRRASLTLRRCAATTLGSKIKNAEGQMTLKTILLLVSVATVLGCESRLSFEELMKQGEQYSAEGKTEKAIEVYKKAVVQKPDDTRAHENLGNAYYQGMEAIFRRSATNAKEWEQIKNEGNKFRDMAVAEYTKVLQKDKDNWKIRYMVAVNLFNQKKYKEAIPQFNQTIQSNPKYAVAYSVLASSYLGVGQYDLALKNIELAHNFDKDDEHYYFCLGKAHYFMKNETSGFEMEKKLKAMNSKYYQDLLDYRFSHNREP